MRGKGWLIGCGIVGALVVALLGMGMILMVLGIGPKIGSNVDREALQLGLPFQIGEAVTEVQGLWPYGVKGGEHPEGHRGIDYELRLGSEVLAAADGIVTRAGPVPDEPTESRVSLRHGSFPPQGETWYVGSLETILVKEGESVQTGQPLATIGPWIQDGRPLAIGSIHFEWFSFQSLPPGAVCPVAFMAADAKAETERLHAESRYQERAAFPAVCNE